MISLPREPLVASQRFFLKEELQMAINEKATGNDSVAITGTASAGERTVVNVKDFGAVGDGVTDDRVAIQNAVNAAMALGAFTVYLPTGIYSVSRAGSNAHSIDFSAADYLQLRGAGKGRSVLRHPSGMPNASVAVVRINNCRGVTVSDLTIDGNWGNAMTRLVDASHGVSLPTATLHVESTADFPSSGTITVVTDQGGPGQIITYTGKTATTLTGCAGGTGRLALGDAVGYIDPGNRTTVARVSNGQALPQGTIHVATTAHFASAGTVVISLVSGPQLVTYTGKTATTLTGCSGGTGTLVTGAVVAEGVHNPGGNHVSQLDPKNYGIFVRGSTDVTIENVEIRQTYGDGIWIGTAADPNGIRGSSNVVISNVAIDMSARNGITFGAQCEDVAIYAVRTTNIATQDFDTEPQTDFSTCRNVSIDSCCAGGWWNKGNPARTINCALSIVGAVQRNPHQSSYARTYRVRNSTFVGAIIITSAADVVVENCRVLCNWTGTSIAPIFVSNVVEDVTVDNCYVYDRTGPERAGGTGHQGAITVMYGAQSSTRNAQPRNVRVSRCSVKARNGRHGIFVNSPGGNAYNTGVGAVYQGPYTGTATAILEGVQGVIGAGGQPPRLQDSGAAWTPNQWQGYVVRVGNACAAIAENTATELRLGDVPSTGFAGGFSMTYAWTGPQGDLVPTPTVGTYVIYQETGTTTIASNTIDCSNDGFGAGANGIRITNEVAGTRIAVGGNNIKNATGAAIFIASSTITPGKDYKRLELTDNYAWDDQLVPTCTHVFGFSNPPIANIWRMRGNTKGDGVAHYFTGLVSGRWLVNDGFSAEWEGFGTPEGNVVARRGSRYRRIDGGAATAFYVKEANDTTSVGWVGK
jgi:hypothetical protein